MTREKWTFKPRRDALPLRKELYLQEQQEPRITKCVPPGNGFSGRVDLLKYLRRISPHGWPLSRPQFAFVNYSRICLHRALSNRRELALLSKCPGQRGAYLVEGPGSAPPQSFNIRCALTDAWNGRRVNCPGLLLGPAVHAGFRIGKGVGAFCELPCQRVGVVRGGSREQISGEAFTSQTETLDPACYH